MTFPSFDFVEGEVLLIDKPIEWTSFGVVKRVRGRIGIKKVGHAGTLDPLATGLLILCTGKKTKQIESFMGQSKEYTGALVLGATRPSIDKETEIDSTAPYEHIDKASIEATALALTGEQEQIPPIYSAIKVDGKRLYKHARDGSHVEIKPRLVNVHEFLITAIDLPRVEFKVTCAKGTYIRSLARDFGEKLGCGAYLDELRRTKIGEFSVDDAYQLPELVAHLESLR